ncbi:unnamed protein product [Jaminaea pallidilutea]
MAGEQRPLQQIIEQCYAGLYWRRTQDVGGLEVWQEARMAGHLASQLPGATASTPNTTNHLECQAKRVRQWTDGTAPRLPLKAKINDHFIATWTFTTGQHGPSRQARANDHIRPG